MGWLRGGQRRQCGFFVLKWHQNHGILEGAVQALWSKAQVVGDRAAPTLSPSNAAPDNRSCKG